MPSSPGRQNDGPAVTGTPASAPGQTDVFPPLFLNEIFRRLTKHRVVRDRLPTMRHYSEHDGKGYRYGPPELEAKTHKILTETEKTLRQAAPYQFQPDAVYSLIDGRTFEKMPPVALPSPITWIDNLVNEGDIDAAYRTGALLVDKGHGEISATLILRIPAQDGLAELISESVTDDLLPHTKQKLSPMLKKLSALGTYKDPLIVGPSIVLDKVTGLLSFNLDEIFMPFLVETMDGWTQIIDFWKMVADQGGAHHLETVIESWRVAAGRAFLLANAVANHDPAIRIKQGPKPKMSADEVAMKHGQAPKRQASTVTLNPNAVPTPVVTDEADPAESPAPTDPIAVEPAAEQIAHVEPLPENIPALPSPPAAAEEPALVQETASADAATPLSDKKAEIPPPLRPANGTPPLFLNEVFQRFGKNRVMQNKLPETPLFYVGTAQGAMTLDEAGAMNVSLFDIENSLRRAMPYQFVSDEAIALFENRALKEGERVVLPSPITWIDRATAALDKKITIGALLADRDDGKISITLFVRQPLEGQKDNRGLADPQDVYGDAQRQQLGPALKKLADLGRHKDPLLIVPDLILDTATNKITAQEATLLPFLVETADGVPFILEHRRSMRDAEYENIGKSYEFWMMSALKAVHLAKALGENSPELKINRAARPRLSGDDLAMQYDRAPKRTASIVDINPDYVPLIADDTAAPVESAALTSMLEDQPQQQNIMPPAETDAPAEPAASNEVPTSPTLLNTLFKRYAKIRVNKMSREKTIKKLVRTGRKSANPPPLFTYVPKLWKADMTLPQIKEVGNPVASAAELAQMDRLLGRMEYGLISAVPYRLTRAAAKMVLDEAEDIAFDKITLPFPITWIDGRAGALLADDGKGKISITVYIESSRNDFNLAEYFKGANAQDERIIASIMPLYDKMMGLGRHPHPVVIPTIVLDKATKTLSFQNEDHILPMLLEAPHTGLPIVANYESHLEELDEAAREKAKQAFLYVAKKTLLAAHLIATKDPSIIVGPVQKPVPINDTVLMNAGKAPSRNAGVVSLNLDYVPGRSAPAILMAEDAEATPVDLPAADTADYGFSDHDAHAVEAIVVDPMFQPEAVEPVVEPDLESLPVEEPEEDLPPEADLRPAALLTEDEQIERELKRIDAFEATKNRLVADAETCLLQAQNRGLNRFDCRILLNKPGFPIRLQFTGEVIAHEEKKTVKSVHVLENYAPAYRARGVPLTMNDAVDLKIIVQSMISNTPGIVPNYDNTAPGQRTVELDTQMPLPLRDYRQVQRSDGTYALILDAMDPYTKKIIHPSVPLGMAALHEDEEAERIELESRIQYVVDYLLDVTDRRSPEGHRIYVTKRDVLMKLQSYLEEQNKEWVTADRMALPGFEDGTVLYESATGNQKITLSPVSLRMAVGGDNPSWYCDFDLYVGDKNKPHMGEFVRSRSMNLHTRNPDLALARALESLQGVKYKSGETQHEGFVAGMRHHMQLTGHEWRIENKGTKHEHVSIGGKPLQHFLDDMKRYEHDIGLKLDRYETDDNGDVLITVQAMRSLTGDYHRSVRFVPEYVHESENGKRKPVAFTLTIPVGKKDRIEDFIRAAHKNFGWHATEAYSSTVLDPDAEASGKDVRKKPLEYRTSQIRQSAIRTIEAQYQAYFEAILPKDWHQPEKSTLLPAKPAARKKAYHQLPRSVLFGMAGRPAHGIRGAAFSRFRLG